jgi:isoleucyl-tRNA synthetase
VRITNMIATRPDWCISRQKIWDVPIAVFLCEQCNRPIVSAELNRAVVALIEREGIEAWRTPAADALLPAGSVCAHCGGTAFRKETDILDVWIDAGVSWFAVCEADPDLKTAYTAFKTAKTFQFCTWRAPTSTAAGSTPRCSPRWPCAATRLTLA